MDDAEPDVLATMTFPPQHRTKLHSTNPTERLNGELERRTPPRSPDRVSCGARSKGLLAFAGRRHLSRRGRHHPGVPTGVRCHGVGTRLGALLLEQNDEWAVQRSRYMSLETIAQAGDDVAVSLTDMTG